MSESALDNRGAVIDLVASRIALPLFLAIALALKAATFGDLNRSADETFYFLVGQRMHDGLLPYVDVWDRKPLGLFLIYYAIAALSRTVWAYQIVACLFAGATAFVVSRIVALWGDARAGLLAGIAYLVTIVALEGATGQSPDFYNLFVAVAVWLVARDTDALSRGSAGWRIWAAMALCGLAITIKQTTLFESAFLGLYVLVRLRQAGTSYRRVLLVGAASLALGALPMLTIAAYYWQAGHWPEFWHAMVTSNFAKAAPGRKLFRAASILLRLAVLLPLAARGLWLCRPSRARLFLAGWLAAALVGFLSVPNFFGHYALPLVLPLSVAAGHAFAFDRRRALYFVALLAFASLWYNPLDRRTSLAGNAAMMRAAALIRQHDGGGGLLVFDGPSYLYALTGKRFLSPLVFPHHLAHDIENNVSHIDTHAEVDRILANRPGVVVMARTPLITPINLYSRGRVLAYVRAHCRVSGAVDIYDGLAWVPFVVFGDCAR